MMKSSYLPGGTKVRSAASASSGVSPRACMISSIELAGVAASLGATELPPRPISNATAPPAANATSTFTPVLVFMVPPRMALCLGIPVDCRYDQNHRAFCYRHCAEPTAQHVPAPSLLVLTQSEPCGSTDGLGLIPRPATA